MPACVPLLFIWVGIFAKVVNMLFSICDFLRTKLFYNHTSGCFGDMLHPIPWQTDHPFCWHRNAADALAA